MIKKPNLLLWILLVGFIAIASCETERDPCLTPQNTLAHAGVYRRTTDTGTAVQDSALPSPVITALTDYTTANSFIFLANRNKLSFQFSDLSDTCRWVLRPDTTSAVRDTLTFYYSRQLHFISNACGYNYYYYLRDMKSTHNAIDSVRITNNNITSDASVEHFKIYL